MDSFNYPNLIEVNIIVDDEGFVRSLSFDNFVNKCKDRLNFIFKHVFKKEQIFNDLLVEICET